MAGTTLKDLVHFVIHQCKDEPERLGAIRLNKALWFIDTVAYQSRGSSVSGAKYVKREMGPVPKAILPTLDRLKQTGKIDIKESQHAYGPRLFISQVDPGKSSGLSKRDQDLARAAVDFVCGHTTHEVSELTHQLAWRAASEGEEIPLCATLVSERGIITERIRRWASKVVRNREEVHS